MSINNDYKALIDDWKANVASHIISSDDTDRLAEYALHMSRILAYPDLNIDGTLKRIDQMADDLKYSLKKLMPLRPTQMIEQINNYLFKDILIT